MVFCFFSAFEIFEEEKKRFSDFFGFPSISRQSKELQLGASSPAIHGGAYFSVVPENLRLRSFSVKHNRIFKGFSVFSVGHIAWTPEGLKASLLYTSPHLETIPSVQFNPLIAYAATSVSDQLEGLQLMNYQVGFETKYLTWSSVHCCHSYFPGASPGSSDGQVWTWKKKRLFHPIWGNKLSGLTCRRPQHASHYPRFRLRGDSRCGWRQLGSEDASWSDPNQCSNTSFARHTLSGGNRGGHKGGIWRNGFIKPCLEFPHLGRLVPEKSNVLLCKKAAESH